MVRLSWPHVMASGVALHRLIRRYQIAQDRTFAVAVLNLPGNGQTLLPVFDRLVEAAHHVVNTSECVQGPSFPVAVADRASYLKPSGAVTHCLFEAPQPEVRDAEIVEALPLALTIAQALSRGQGEPAEHVEVARIGAQVTEPEQRVGDLRGDGSELVGGGSRLLCGCDDVGPLGFQPVQGERPSGEPGLVVRLLYGPAGIRGLETGTRSAGAREKELEGPVEGQPTVVLCVVPEGVLTSEQAQEVVHLVPAR